MSSTGFFVGLDSYSVSIEKINEERIQANLVLMRSIERKIVNAIPQCLIKNGQRTIVEDLAYEELELLKSGFQNYLELHSALKLKEFSLEVENATGNEIIVYLMSSDNLDNPATRYG
jgi:hypothetical protein